MRDAPPPGPAALRGPPRHALYGYLLAVAVLIVAVVVVQMYVHRAERRELDAAESAFAAATDEATALLRQRLDSYELVNRGGVSLFASVARPSRRQWEDYVAGLNLSQRFPSLVGLGFAIYASPGQLSDLQKLMRASGEGLFPVYPHGPREHYGAILYLEPQTPQNVAAVGYDMYSEPVRHAAMQAAMDTGQPRLTGLVHLVQDEDQSRQAPAVQIYLPVYRAGDRPATIAARREAMQGWIYAPFHVDDFVGVSLRTTRRRVHLRIVDTTDSREQVLYADPVQPEIAAFTRSTLVEAYGRRWRIDYESEPQAALEARMASLRISRVIGFLAALLLSVVILALARTRVQAERLAARMAESYRRSEVRFRAAMQYSAIGKALLDHRGRIVEVNPSLARILGASRDHLVGTPFNSHFVDDADPIRTREMEAMPDGVLRVTRSLRRTDGDVRQAQLTFAPVPGEIGQDITRLVQVEDVTDRVRAEAQVLALNRSLEARVAMRTHELTMANRELERFAYSVSHDLRAPLRAIDGFSRLLGERYAQALGEEGREYVARVRSAASRMGELIDSLLKMARLSRGDLRLRELDLSRMAADVISELRASEPQREVRVDIAPGLAAVGDSGLARSLVQNLLGNAWKFTRLTGDARVEFGRTADGEFFVRDNGAGFDPEYADKLFRPFQRLHSQADFAGHGIGLASVKRIVERHGGGIRAEGRPGEGATFYFTLPERAPEA